MPRVGARRVRGPVRGGVPAAPVLCSDGAPVTTWGPVSAAVQRLNDEEAHVDWSGYADDQQLVFAACPLLLAENAQLRAQLAQVAEHLELCGDCNVCVLEMNPDLHAAIGALADLPDAEGGHE